VDRLARRRATQFNGAKGDKLAELYADTALQVVYEPGASIAEVSIRVNTVRVRGRTCTRFAL
jgi:hypothetical protein